MRKIYIPPVLCSLCDVMLWNSGLRVWFVEIWCHCYFVRILDETWVLVLKLTYPALCRTGKARPSTRRLRNLPPIVPISHRQTLSKISNSTNTVCGQSDDDRNIQHSKKTSFSKFFTKFSTKLGTVRCLVTFYKLRSVYDTWVNGCQRLTVTLINKLKL